MYELRVNEKIYKIKYGYGVLYKSDLIDKVIAVSTGNPDNPADTVKNMMGITAELLLAGLQKKHKDEFGYDWESESERNAMILKVCDLIDDYEDEHRNDEVEEGGTPPNGFTLFSELQAELEKNGFLSMITRAGAATLADQDSTIVPLDHQKKRGRKPAGEKA